jgi:hypothetical protein
LSAKEELDQMYNNTHSRQHLVFVFVMFTVSCGFAQNQTPANPPQATWTDPVTGLIWTNHYYAVLLDWIAAKNYCESLRLDGRSNWRLPEYDELRSIHDDNISTDAYFINGQRYAFHIKGGIKLSGSTDPQQGMIWSNIGSINGGYVWAFNWSKAQDNHNAPMSAGSAWTLCVWKSAERIAREERDAALPVWSDSATGLMWTRSDNGNDVDWNSAVSYCQNLSLGGYSGWRLPSIDELQEIYDPDERVSFHGDQQAYSNFKGGSQTEMTCGAFPKVTPSRCGY